MSKLNSQQQCHKEMILKKKGMSVLLKIFSANAQGNIGLIFALFIPTLLIATGVAIDGSRLVMAHNQMQYAVDAAALNAALSIERGNKRQMRKDGEVSFHTNLSSNNALSVTRLKIQSDRSNVVTVTAQGKLEPSFVQIFGYPRLDIAVSAKSNSGHAIGVEIVIAVDSTNSMASGSQWETAMSSVESILDQMKQNTGSEDFYISLVPFRDRVNIGPQNQHLVRGSIPANWEGCVEPNEEREGQYNWMLNDKRPRLSGSFTASTPGSTLEFDNGTYTINCPLVSIIGPVDDPGILISALKDLTPGVTGRPDIGLAWSRRLLSANWGGKWGTRGYPARNLRTRNKYLIFMTDGKTAIHQAELSAEPGFERNSGSAVLFEHFEKQCENIKADGIEIFMLEIAGNPHASPYLKRCASSQDQYYEINSPSDISNAFRGVLTKFESDVRLIE